MSTEEILQIVDTKQFYCSITFKENIPLKSIKLPLYVNVMFNGKISANPFRPEKGIYIATGISDVSGWTRILKYKDLPIITGRESIIGEWIYIDYETLSCIMKVDIYVYYQNISLDERKDYFVIYNDGTVIKLEWNENYHSQTSFVPNRIYTGNEVKDQINILVVPI